MKEQALPLSEYEEPVEMTIFRHFKESKGSSVESVKAILASYKGDSRRIRDSSKQTMLHVACDIMDDLIVKLLVEDYKFSVNVQDIRGNTPLHLACSSQQVQNVMYLANLPACDPNIRNSNGQTPLHIAGLIGPASLLNILLNCHRVDRTITDNSGKTALTIIVGNPALSWCLNRRLSSASMTVLPGRKNSREEVHRKSK